MSNVIDIKNKVKTESKPTIVASAEENHTVMLFAFGVESTFIKVENLDDDSVKPVYGAEFRLSDTPGVLVSFQVVDAAVDTWDERFGGRFFDSYISALLQFIEIVSEYNEIEDIYFDITGANDD